MSAHLKRKRKEPICSDEDDILGRNTQVKYTNPKVHEVMNDIWAPMKGVWVPNKVDAKKVDTVRKTGLAEVDGAFGCLQPEAACAQKSSLGKASNDMKSKRITVSRKHPKRLCKNCNEETDSEYLEVIRLSSPVTEFQHIKNFQSFTIIDNNLIIG